MGKALNFDLGKNLPKTPSFGKEILPLGRALPGTRIHASKALSGDQIVPFDGGLVVSERMHFALCLLCEASKD